MWTHNKWMYEAKFYLMDLKWSGDVWCFRHSMETGLVSICKVHIHLSPLDMGTGGRKILKLKQRSLEWVAWVCSQHKVT